MAVIRESKPVVLTELEICRRIVGFYDINRIFCAVPNVATWHDWEADLLVVSKAGWMTEFEVKISAGDWRQDRYKKKWIPEMNRQTAWERTKSFWYAAPLKLAQRWKEIEIPDHAGVLGIEETENGRVRVVRPASRISGSRKLTTEEMAKLARLGALRMWTTSPSRDLNIDNLAIAESDKAYHQSGLLL